MRNAAEILATSIVGKDPSRTDLVRLARAAYEMSERACHMGHTDESHQLRELARLALETADLKEKENEKCRVLPI